VQKNRRKAQKLGHFKQLTLARTVSQADAKNRVSRLQTQYASTIASTPKRSKLETDQRAPLPFIGKHGSKVTVCFDAFPLHKKPGFLPKSD